MKNQSKYEHRTTNLKRFQGQRGDWRRGLQEVNLSFGRFGAGETQDVDIDAGHAAPIVDCLDINQLASAQLRRIAEAHDAEEAGRRLLGQEDVDGFHPNLLA
jgi:hypothetical protein